MTQPLAPQLRAIAYQLRQIRPAPAGLEPIIRQVDVLAREVERRLLMSAEHRMAVCQIIASLKDLGKGKPKYISRLDLFYQAIDKLNEIIEPFLPRQGNTQ